MNAATVNLLLGTGVPGTSAQLIASKYVIGAPFVDELAGTTVNEPVTDLLVVSVAAVPFAVFDDDAVNLVAQACSLEAR